MYHIKDDHKNGIVNTTSLTQQQKDHSSNTTDIPHDKAKTVKELEQQNLVEENTTALKEHETISSVISEETKKSKEETLDKEQTLLEGLTSVEEDTEMNEDDAFAGFDHLEMEVVDYAQEELYEAVEETKDNSEEESSTNNKADGEVNGEEKQGELETVNSEQVKEQLETSKSSQSVSSSSSYTASPVVDKNSTRVSLIRELDTNYEQPTDMANVSLCRITS